MASTPIPEIVIAWEFVRPLYSLQITPRTNCGQTSHDTCNRLRASALKRGNNSPAGIARTHQRYRTALPLNCGQHPHGRAKHRKPTLDLRPKVPSPNCFPYIGTFPDLVGGHGIAEARTVDRLFCPFFQGSNGCLVTGLSIPLLALCVGHLV